MKVGFIGFGKSVHRFHAPFINLVKEIEVVGYFKPGNGVFDMQYPGFKQLIKYNTIEQFIKSEIELVIISTPNKHHYSYAKQMLNAGKHVLVEKPMCRTLTEAIELYKIAKAKNVKLSPYQNRRYDSDLIQYGLDTVNIYNAIGKFLTVSLLSIVMSYLVSFVIRKNLLFRKVI